MTKDDEARCAALFAQVIDVADLVKMCDGDEDTHTRVHRDKAGDYVLTGGGYEYEIERRRINTGPKLVEWVLHLLGKDWTTKGDIKALMQLVIADCPGVIDRSA